jgi:hypothetical protein
LVAFCWGLVFGFFATSLFLVFRVLLGLFSAFFAFVFAAVFTFNFVLADGVPFDFGVAL